MKKRIVFKTALLPMAAAGLSLLFAAACTPSISAEMVLIQGGDFIMGSPETDPDYIEWEGPEHQVTISSFYLGKYTVTQREYEAVMGNNPSFIKTESNPAETVSWYNAVEFCNALSKQDKLKPAYIIKDAVVTWDRNANGYRLPTEAEWEYACRAGTHTYYNTGNTITTAQAHFNADSPVASGSYEPNGWGLYDMHGNVYEWCWDWYGDYSAEAQINPPGAESGTRRIMRGGSGGSNAQHLRSAERGRAEPSIRNINLGFRLARNAKG